ncbi:hypothetical protein ACPVPU_00475 [Sphingomonas sp. CJ99]
MTSFDLIFAVFGLLLGLAIAEVLQGFARVLKYKRGEEAVYIGWLTPLLGLLVILDLTSFWLMAWDAQGQFSANYLTLVAILVVVGIYYLAASLIFPDELEERIDLDAWYKRQKRLVIGGLLAANIGTWIGQAALEAVAPSPEVPLDQAIDTIIVLCGLGILGTLIALLFVKRRRRNIVLLSTTIALLLIGGIAESMA